MEPIIDDEAFCESALHSINVANVAASNGIIEEAVASSARVSSRELVRGASSILKTRAHQLRAAEAVLLSRLLSAGLSRWEASAKPPRAVVWDDALGCFCAAALLSSIASRIDPAEELNAEELLAVTAASSAAACSASQFTAPTSLELATGRSCNAASDVIRAATGLCLLAACGAKNAAALTDAHKPSLATAPGAAAALSAAARLPLLPDMVQLARSLLVAVCDGTRSLWRAAADVPFTASAAAAGAGDSSSSLSPLAGVLRANEPRDMSTEASLVAFAFSCESPVCGDAEEDEDDEAGAHSGGSGGGRSLLPHTCLPAARSRIGDDGDRVRRFLQELWPALLRAPCTGGCAGVTHGLRLAAARSIITAFAVSYGLGQPQSPPVPLISTAGAGAGVSDVDSAVSAASPPALWPMGMLSQGEELRLLAAPAAIVLLHVAAAAMRGGLASETLLGAAGAAGDEDQGDDGDAAASAEKRAAAEAGSAHARSGLEAADLAIASLMRCLHALRMLRSQQTDKDKDKDKEGLPFLLPAAYGRVLDAATPAADAASASAPSFPASSSLPSSSVALPPCVSAARAPASPTEPPGDLALLQGLLLLLSAHAPDARLRGRAYAAFSALLGCYSDGPRFRLIAMLLIPPQSPQEAAKAKAKVKGKEAPAAASASLSPDASPASGSAASDRSALLHVTMTRHVAAAESVSGAINRSVQLRGAVLDALRSAVAAAAGRWLQAASAAAHGAGAAASAASSAPAPVPGSSGSCSSSVLLGAEAVDLLREIMEARAGMGISQRPWVHALAAAASASARPGATASTAAASTLDLPASVGDTAAEAAALVEQSDIDMSLLSTVRLLLLQAAKAARAFGGPGGVAAAADAPAAATSSGSPHPDASAAKRPRLEDSGADADSAATVLPPLLAAFAPHGGAATLTSRLRDAYVRPLAAAVRGVQQHYRRQVGAVLLAPHHEPVPAASLTGAVAAAAPSTEQAMAAVKSAAAAAVAAEPAAQHRDEDAALLSRLALLDAAIDPVMALLH